MQGDEPTGRPNIGFMDVTPELSQPKTAGFPIGKETRLRVRASLALLGIFNG
jgi:hypothetical protein